jgi:hypothetical protein
MRTSEVIDQLAAALVAAQGAFPRITKGKIARVPTKGGGEYSYRYADLADILSVVQPVLSANGLAVVGIPDTTEGGKPALTTRLVHTSGQWIEATVELFLSQETPQGQGSALTYARRYGFCGVLNIAADEDDDAGLAEAQRPARRRSAGRAHGRADTESAEMVTDAQLRNIGRLFGVLGVTERDKRLEYTSAAVGRQVDSSKLLTRREASKLIDLLEHDSEQQETRQEAS